MLLLNKEIATTSMVAHDLPVFPGQAPPENVQNVCSTSTPSPSSSTMASSQLALGLDLSTQQLKILAIDISNLETFYERSLTFETDLPHYKTVKGVYTNDAEHEVSSPVEMWIEALDVILTKMKEDNFPFHNVVALSGACQVILLTLWCSWD